MSCKCNKPTKPKDVIIAVLMTVALVVAALALAMGLNGKLKRESLSDLFVTNSQLVDPEWLKQRNAENSAEFLAECLDRASVGLSKKIVTQEEVANTCKRRQEAHYHDRDWVGVAKRNHEYILKGFKPRVP